MKVVDTLSSKSITGVYRVKTLMICWEQQNSDQDVNKYWMYRIRQWRLCRWRTCAVVRAVHMLQIAKASASVFFFICRSCAAWMRGSSDSFAPLSVSSFSASHSSSCQTLYLKTDKCDRGGFFERSTIQVGSPGIIVKTSCGKQVSCHL